MTLSFPARLRGREEESPLFVLEVSVFMAGSKSTWKLPLEGAFECPIRAGIGICEGVFMAEVLPQILF